MKIMEEKHTQDMKVEEERFTAKFNAWSKTSNCAQNIKKAKEALIAKGVGMRWDINA